MLPCASHATSVGRGEARRRCDARAGRAAAGTRRRSPAPPLPPPPAAAAAAGCIGDRDARRPRRQRQRRNRIASGLRLEHHLHAAVRIELDHLRRHLIDDPDVVLRIDAHLLRAEKP